MTLFWTCLNLSVAAGFCGGMSLAGDAAQTPELKDLPLQESVSQYGITWKFDKKVPVGQFVTGDYYVVGPAKVLEVTPTPTGTGRAFRNGSMLNPPVTVSTAYDGRWSEGFRADLITRYPLELKPGDSLVSTISLEAGDPIEKVAGNISDGERLRSAAVLTCLAQAVPADTFRPGYCDQKKDHFHRAAEIHWELLPSVPAPTSKPHWSWAELERAFQRPWIDHIYSWGNEEAHAAENMPDYGYCVAWVVSEAALMLCTDASRDHKTRLCQEMIQVGIDNWAIARRGKHGKAGGWINQGGYGPGRKFPIVFAAVMLQDPEMMNITKNAPETAFGEDEATEFGQTWTGANVCYTGQYPVSGTPNRGPYENLYPSIWPGPNRTMAEGYRRVSSYTASIGAALAAHLMKAENVWDHDAFFAYTDRWMYEDDTEAVRSIKVALGVKYGARDHADAFTDEMWAKYRQSPGIAPVAAFRKEIEEKGEVKIGPNREFLVNGKKLFPVMLFAQAKVNVKDAEAHGRELAEGKIPRSLFVEADAQAQEALDLGTNTVFVNGDAGQTTWGWHYGREFLRRIADKGLYGVLGADTEVFGHPNLLGVTQEDQPDRPVTMFTTPPMPVKIDARILNRPRRSHGAAQEVFNPATDEEGVLLENMEGAEVRISLAREVTVSSLMVCITPGVTGPNARLPIFLPDGTLAVREDAKDILFLADGKEILKVSLKQERGDQKFNLPNPVSFKELVFRVVSVYPGKAGYGFIKQVGAFDEKGQRVYLYDYEPQLRSVEKVWDVYHWMRKMQKTRPVFLTLSSGFMSSSATWDKETRQTLYPGYIASCDAAGFMLPPDPATGPAEWLNRVGEEADELGKLAGARRPVVFWLEATSTLKPAEARAAIWNAIIHGATAIGYRMQPRDKSSQPDGEMTAALKQLNQQITRLAPAILSDPARVKAAMAMTSGQQCGCKATESGGSIFIFAQNLGSEGKAVIHVDGLRAGTNIEAVGEGRTVVSSQGEFSDAFAPLSEHVYRLEL